MTLLLLLLMKKVFGIAERSNCERRKEVVIGTNVCVCERERSCYSKDKTEEIVVL